MDETEEKKNKHAKALSELGASKGGAARANVLTPNERREIARQAARSRWMKAGKLKEGPVPEPQFESAVYAEVRRPAGRAGRKPDQPDSMPYSMFPGTVRLGNMDLECHVLNDGRRVFTQREVVRALSGGRESGNLGRYLDRNPLTSQGFSTGPTIPFTIPGSGGSAAIGHEATLLIEICDKYLEARDQELIKGRQLKLAVQAEMIVRSCAKVGIIALIDEATGYQQVRAKNALQLKLQAFIADELQEWARMFPEEFWLELARLEGVRYSTRLRPLRWGKYVMAFVYDAIDKDVGTKLREINPNPRHRMNHHQWLKQFGREKVNNQLQRVIAVMKLCDTMEDFKKKFARVFQRAAYQITFEDIDWGIQN
jgi:hypothetical protein